MESELKTQIPTQPTTAIEPKLGTQTITQIIIFKSKPYPDHTHGSPPEVEPDIQTTQNVLEKLKASIRNNIQPSVFNLFVTPTKEALSHLQKRL